MIAFGAPSGGAQPVPVGGKIGLLISPLERAVGGAAQVATVLGWVYLSGRSDGAERAREAAERAARATHERIDDAKTRFDTADDHAEALVEDGGPRSVQTAATLISTLDAGCNR